MATTWILIANGRRARFFESDTKKVNLGELANFLAPHSLVPRHDTGGSPNAPSAAIVQGRSSHSGIRIDTRRQSPDSARRCFARQLAEFVNRGVADSRCDQVALIASGSMLGALKPLLSPGAALKLRCSVASDLTRYRGSELRHRIIETVGPLA